MFPSEKPGGQGRVYRPTPKAGKVGDDKAVVTAFGDGVRPMGGLREPNPYLPKTPEFETLDVLIADTLVPENEKKVGRVKASIGNICGFAKAHPFLTAGFVAGIVFLASAFIFFGYSFAGITGVQLASAHITLGFGMGVIFLYYGIALINLARQAKKKDALEAQIEQIDRTIKVQKQKILQKIKVGMKTDFSEERAEITSLIAKIENEEIQLPKKVRENANKALQELQNAVVDGCTLLRESKAGFSRIKSTVSFTDKLTDAQVVNQGKIAKIKAGLSYLYNSVGDIKELPKTMMKHKMATGLVLLGLVTALIAIPVAYYWLSGMSSVMLIGGVSGVVLAQFIIYGLSIIYEGYHAAQIEKMQEKFNQITQQGNEEEKAFEEDLSRLEGKIQSEQLRRKEAVQKARTAIEYIYRAMTDQVSSQAKTIADLQSQLRGAEFVGQ